jgi:membrane carboxypeptidase/penicillin-binding protein PbpC
MRKFKFRFNRKKVFFWFGGIVLFLLLILFIRIGFLTHKILNNNLPQQSVKILDRNGKLLYEQIIPTLGFSNFTKLQDVNPKFLDIIIALEDKDFYSNSGVDVGRNIKCVFDSTTTENKCGASTITQQFVKEELGNNDRNLFAKTDEFFISLFVNTFDSKQDILERYVNNIYFGNLRYGIEAASQGYFGKSNKNLDMAQITFLAGLPNAPDKLNPYKNFEGAKERQKIVLKTLKENNIIGENEIDAIYNQKIELVDERGEIKAPHLVSEIVSDYADYLGKDYTDFKNKNNEMITSLDLDLYNETKDIVNKHLDEIKRFKASNAAVVILDVKTGEILTMLGSKDFFSKDIDGQTNLALASRQPGSTLKPFLYGLGFSKDITPATLINDKEQVFSTFDGKYYYPRDYDKNEHGFVAVREALGNSYNIPAVVELKRLGIDNFYDVLENVGIQNIRNQRPDLSAALGSFDTNLLELTNAYRTFPLNGNYPGKATYLKNRIQDVDKRKKVFGDDSAEISYMISDILADDNARRREFGSLSDLSLPFKASVKTGTTTDFRDSWTVGYTNDFVVGVWVGNNDNSPMDGVSGAKGAALIWHDVMVATDKYYGTKQVQNDKLQNIISKKICSTTGEIYSKNNCEGFGYDEIFIKDKTPELKDIVKKIDVIDPNLIFITDPEESDTFYTDASLDLKVEFLANSEFEKYELYVDDKICSTLENTKKRSFNCRVEKGKYRLKVIGYKEGKSYESQILNINIEQES